MNEFDVWIVEMWFGAIHIGTNFIVIDAEIEQ